MKRIPLAMIRFYQRRISGGLPPSCRFQPTCSHYAYEAIEVHGVVRGLALAAWRILRCNPLNDGGIDNVPTASGKEQPAA
jgi:putative membrane protein insertion efficiency factor